MSPAIFSSIRASLILLVVVAVLPTLGIMLYTGHELRETLIASAEVATLRQVQSMADHQQRVVDDARLLLLTLSEANEVRQLDHQTCQNLLDEMQSRDAAYLAIALADTAGRIVAASPVGSFTRLDNRPFFHRALQEQGFVTGQYHSLSWKEQVVIDFAQPVFAANGELRGVLVATFDLNSFSRIFANAHLPEGSVFTLTDTNGTRLTRFPDNRGYTLVADLPEMVARMSGGAEEGTFQARGQDGVFRLYGYKRLVLAGAPFPYLMLRLGMPVEDALAEARRVVVRNSAFLLLAAGLTMIAARAVAERTIIRRLQALIEAAETLGAGDLKVRSGQAGDSGELGRLAAAFDLMAENLENQEWERQKAEEEVCILNTELEERVTTRTAQLAKANADLKTALENLHQAQGQLVLSEKLAALAELVAGVAHEINTPVGVALSATSTMAERNRTLHDLFTRGEMKRSDLNEYLASADEGLSMTLLNLHRASELIRSFKMVAADQVSENRRSFNVRDYIGEILLSLRPRLKKTCHQVEVSCRDDLVIKSYPGAFSQIITNLIFNSLIHAYDEGEAGRLRIEVGLKDGILTLVYSDDGRGIEPEVLNKIFEPFYTTARARGSTGLGLHIVFNIVSSTLGGSITCCSEPGLGTTFHLQMPVESEPPRRQKSEQA